MAIVPIVTTPNKILRTKSLPVDVENYDYMALLNDLKDTMEYHEGAGIAAVQIGIHQRVFIIEGHIDQDNEVPERWHGHVICFINPVLSNYSDDTRMSHEGCLSVPEQKGDVKRHSNITIQYLDHNLEEHTVDIQGEYLSICIQHEYEHLDGKLYIDHMGPIKKDLMMRKAKKIQKHLQQSDKEHYI